MGAHYRGGGGMKLARFTVARVWPDGRIERSALRFDVEADARAYAAKLAEQLAAVGVVRPGVRYRAARRHFGRRPWLELLP